MLESCANCGHQISKTANQCPECHDSNCHPVICSFCGKSMHRLKAHAELRTKSNYAYEGQGEVYILFHADCYESYCEKYYTPPNACKCPECKRTLNFTYRDVLSDRSCPGCGCRRPLDGLLGSCTICRHPVYSFQPHEKSKTSESWKLWKPDIYAKYWHRRCLEEHQATSRRNR